MRIYYTPESLEDLQNMKRFIIEIFYDENLASDVLKSLVTSIRNLELFPYMGKELILSAGKPTGYRYLFCKHNYVFYRVEHDVVRVIRVLHERQDYLHILFGNQEE